MKKYYRHIIIGIIFCFILMFGFNIIYKQKAVSTISGLQDLPDVNFIIKAEKIFLNERETEIYSHLKNSSRQTIINDFINYKILYRSGDYEVIGMISAPADYMYKKYPVLIHNRGGHDEFGKENFGIVQAFASYGFIVLASNYRGADGGTGKDMYGGDDVEDVKKMVDLAESLSFGNGKIYMHGWSRGGIMTYCALRGGDTRINAAVIFAAPSNLLSLYESSELKLKKVLVSSIGGNPGYLPDEYKKRSVLFWADEIYTPLMIIHGELDDKTNVEQSYEIYDKMKNLGKDVELKILHDDGHDISSNIVNTIAEWLLLK